MFDHGRKVEHMGNFAEMATDEMRRYKPDSPKQLRELENHAFTIAQNANAVFESAREHFYFSMIQDIVENEYDIGKLLEVYQIFGGYINTTFGVYTEKDGEKQTWLLRMYMRGKTLDSLLFEHKLVLTARNNGFDLIAAPIMTNKGISYTERTLDMGEGEGEDLYYFAIFNYIDGEDRYDWIKNWAPEGVEEATIISGAKAMAGFHSSTFNYDAEGRFGDNLLHINEDLSCNEIIRQFPQILREYRQDFEKAGLSNPYVEYYDATLAYYDEMCAKAHVSDEDYKEFVICPCQCDFHGGNFLYKPDGNVAGVFDFDSAKFDARVFEVGVGTHYVFSSWLLANEGELVLDKTELFIKTYNEECARLGVIPPLNETEKKCLFQEFLQAPIYIDGWCAAAVDIDMTLDPYEYLYYAKHFTDCLQWLEAHKDEVEALAARL